MDSKQRHELNKVKNKLFGSAPKDKDKLLAMVKVMRVVGGYDSLMNLPIPAYMAVLEGINREEEEDIKRFRCPLMKPRGRKR